MTASLDLAATFIWRNARLLERAIFEYQFVNGSSERIVRILQAYQNKDGGFGHALEPDLRTPESQALYTGFALGILHDCNLRAPDITAGVCNYLVQHADLAAGLPMITPSSAFYPRAAHWNNPGNAQPSLEVLVGLVGLCNWQGVNHPWLAAAVESCLQHITAAVYDNAHTIGSAFYLLECLPQDVRVRRLYAKLAQELTTARWFNWEVPIKTYGLTPLDFALTPDSYCRPIFTSAQISGHLDELASEQQTDGGWPILWEPPSEMALQEWRAIKTVKSLAVLRAYGRI